MTGPDFLIIGAARSGTTMLCSILSKNSRIGISDPKEPHFLAYGGRAISFCGPGDDETINRRAVLDRGAWLRLFELPAASVGEGSVTTFYEYEKSIPAIKKFCPEVKLIVLLREPIERAFSAFMYMTGRGFETASFVEALELEERRVKEGFQHIWHYAGESRYGPALSAFGESFPTDQVHLMFYENLLLTPEEELGRLHSFLGVPPVAESLHLGNVVNRSGVPRSAFAVEALKKIGSSRLRGPGRRLVPFSVREAVRSRLLRSDVRLSELERTVAVGKIGSTALQCEIPGAPDWTRRDS